MLKPIIIILSLTLVNIVIISGCEQKMDIEIIKKEIKATDKAFSDFSKKNGYKKAFVEFVDDHGVLLRPNSMPVVGKEAVGKLVSSVDDSKFTLTWEPIFADAAESGDLGYTYCTYKLVSDGNILEGTYVSIWKKDNNGEWKYVLDTGNEGLGH